MATLVLEVEDRELEFFKELLSYFPFVTIKSEQKEINENQVSGEDKEG